MNRHLQFRNSALRRCATIALTPRSHKEVEEVDYSPGCRKAGNGISIVDSIYTQNSRKSSSCKAEDIPCQCQTNRKSGRRYYKNQNGSFRKQPKSRNQSDNRDSTANRNSYQTQKGNRSRYGKRNIQLKTWLAYLLVFLTLIRPALSAELLEARGHNIKSDFGSSIFPVGQQTFVPRPDLSSSGTLAVADGNFRNSSVLVNMLKSRIIQRKFFTTTCSCGNLKPYKIRLLKSSEKGTGSEEKPFDAKFRLIGMGQTTWIVLFVLICQVIPAYLNAYVRYRIYRTYRDINPALILIGLLRELSENNDVPPELATNISQE